MNGHRREHSQMTDTHAATVRMSQRRSLATLAELLAVPDLPPITWRVGFYNDLYGQVAVSTRRLEPAEIVGAWDAWVLALQKVGATVEAREAETGDERLLSASCKSYGPNGTLVVISARFDLPQGEQ
jgi:hypothetical protein